jgi:hypothetical protein
MAAVFGTGQLLDGRYEILELLAEGMGAVCPGAPASSRR